MTTATKETKHQPMDVIKRVVQSGPNHPDGPNGGHDDQGGPDLTPRCLSCWTDRVSQGKSPRPLFRLPRETENKDIPVWVCKYCDGDVLDNARKFADESDS